MDLILIAILIVLVSALLWKSTRKPNNFPPGPGRLPLLGSMPLLPKEVRAGKIRMSTYLKEKYGNIVGMYAATRPMIFISDYNYVKDLYKLDVASDRPNFRPFHELRFGKEDGLQRGLLQSSGPEWVEQRRFALRQLRDLGFGKSSMEDTINDEVDKLVGLLKKEAESNNGKLSLNLKLNLSIVNALWVILVGEELDLEDPQLAEIIQRIDNVLRVNARINTFMNSLSPALTKKYDKTFHQVSDAFEAVKSVIKPYVEKHKKTFQPEYKEFPRDFVDVYLNEISNAKDPKSSFFGQMGEDSLVAVLLDLFLAGTETTSSSLLWIFLHLLHRPDIQQKVHDEIDKVVGKDRHPRLDDRAELPYTQAVLMESMRMASIVPAGLTHSMRETTNFAGYTLPKKSLIFACVMDIHYDPKIWDNPEEFKPERFYNEDTNTYIPNEKLIPFLIGKRFCLGQSLAEKEFFLFFVGLMQSFEFLPPTGSISDLPSMGKSSGVQVGTIRCCPIYDVLVKKRK